MNRERTPAQLEAQKNLVPFKPGQSGNPAGRPKAVPNFAAAVDRMLLESDPVTKRTRLDEIVQVVLDACMRGEPWAIEMLVKRLWPVPVGVNLNAQVAVVPDVDASLEALERALAVYEARRDAEPGGQ